MGYAIQPSPETTRRRTSSSSQKTASGNFFAKPNKTRPENRCNPLKTRQGNHPAPTKNALGVHFKNYLDHVYAVSDDNGNIDEHYRYSAFGEVEIYSPTGVKLAASAIDNTVMWNSRRYDADSGLYYYKYRHYKADIGRWLGRDPINEHGGVNLYAFVGNRPLFFYDIFGLTTIEKPIVEEGRAGFPNPQEIDMVKIMPENVTEMFGLGIGITKIEMYWYVFDCESAKLIVKGNYNIVLSGFKHEIALAYWAKNSSYSGSHPKDRLPPGARTSDELFEQYKDERRPNESAQALINRLERGICTMGFVSFKVSYYKKTKVNWKEGDLRGTNSEATLPGQGRPNRVREPHIGIANYLSIPDFDALKLKPLSVMKGVHFWNICKKSSIPH